MLIAATLFDFVLAIHILAVVIAFGVVFAYPVLDATYKRSNPGNLASLHRLHLALASKVITPAMVVVLLAGVYLALDRYSLGDPWISATFAILFILFALVGAVLTPTDRRLAELAARDQQSGGGQPSADYLAESRKADLFGSIALLLVVVAIVLMTVKPGA
jgi:uncharacterized membrane protein